MLNAYYASALMNKTATSTEQRMRNLENAVTHLQKAIEIYPNFPKTYATLGDALAMLGRKTDAEIAYKRSIELKPDDYTYINNYGNFLFSTGRAEEAETQFLLALQLKPDDARANSNLGSVYGNNAKEAMQRGDTLAFNQYLDKALNQYQLAIRYDSEFAEAYDYAAMIYRFRGDQQMAETYQNKANSLKKKLRKRK